MTDIALWQVGNTRAAIQEYAQLAGSGTSYLWPFAPSVF